MSETSPTGGTPSPEPRLLDDPSNRSLVDGFRAMGILLVIALHAMVGSCLLVPQEQRIDYVSGTPGWLNIAWQAYGSETIFLFSAFLLGYLLFDEQRRKGGINVGRYYVRRVARIVPLYLVALAFYYPFNQLGFDQLLINLVFLGTALTGRTIVIVGWSMETMVLMYLAMPIVALIALRSGRPLAVLIGLTLVSLAVRAIPLTSAEIDITREVLACTAKPDLPRPLWELYYLPWYRATPFLIGMVMAWLAVHRRDALKRFFGATPAGAILTAISLLIVIAMCQLPWQDTRGPLHGLVEAEFWLALQFGGRFVFATALAVFALGLLCSRAAWLTPFRWFLGRPIFGLMSRNIYGIYLFHMPLLLPAAMLGFWAVDAAGAQPVTLDKLILTFFIGLALVVPFAAIMTRFIEDPARKWLRNRFGLNRKGEAAT